MAAFPIGISEAEIGMHTAQRGKKLCFTRKPFACQQSLAQIRLYRNRQMVLFRKRAHGIDRTDVRAGYDAVHAELRQHVREDPCLRTPGLRQRPFFFRKGAIRR
jgi:hypothetical protein